MNKLMQLRMEGVINPRREDTAAHEAAHAVLSIALGGRVHSASVSPWDMDGLTAFDGLVRHEMPDVKQLRDVVSVGGFVAEQVRVFGWNPEQWEVEAIELGDGGGALDDLQTVVDGIVPRLPVDYFEEIVVGALVTLHRYRAQWLRLASLLEQVDTIHGDDVHLLWERDKPGSDLPIDLKARDIAAYLHGAVYPTGPE
jgi:hypothetical protein